MTECDRDMDLSAGEKIKEKPKMRISKVLVLSLWVVQAPEWAHADQGPSYRNNAHFLYDITRRIRYSCHVRPMQIPLTVSTRR